MAILGPTYELALVGNGTPLVINIAASRYTVTDSSYLESQVVNFYDEDDNLVNHAKIPHGFAYCVTKMS